jgi:hypothetical protein
MHTRTHIHIYIHARTTHTHTHNPVDREDSEPGHDVQKDREKSRQTSQDLLRLQAQLSRAAVELARVTSELAGMKAVVRLSAGDLVTTAQDERGMITELAMLCHSLQTCQVNGNSVCLFVYMYVYICI